MTQYALTDEQELLRRTIRQMALERVAPRAAEIDARAEYPQDMFELLQQADLLGLTTPEAYGGSGGGVLTGCLAVEELGRVCYNTAYLLVVQWAPLAAILAAGTEEQKQHYLRGLACGDLRGAMGITEPSFGSDVARLQTRATLQGDHYYLSGTKVFCTNSSVADFIVIAARTGQTTDSKAISAFIVEKGTPGLVVGRAEHKLGGRGVPSCEVRLEEAKVPKSQLLGPENEGFKIVMSAFNHARPIMGARGVGLAQGAMDLAIDYAKQRVAFGQPIAKHQGLRWMIADMAIQIEAARHLVYRAASAIDEGLRGRELAAIVAMAKCFATDVAMKVAVDAVQVFGSYGVSQEYPIERFLRDAKLLQIIEGTNQIQRNIVANSIIGV